MNQSAVNCNFFLSFQIKCLKNVCKSVQPSENLESAKADSLVLIPSAWICFLKLHKQERESGPLNYFEHSFRDACIVVAAAITMACLFLPLLLKEGQCSKGGEK